MLVNAGQLLTVAVGRTTQISRFWQHDTRRGTPSWPNLVLEQLGIQLPGRARYRCWREVGAGLSAILLIGNTFVGCKSFVFSPVNGLTVSKNAFLSCGTVIVGDHEATPIPSKLARSVHITQNSFVGGGACAAVQIEYASGVEIAGNDFTDCGLKGTAASGAGVVIQLAGGPVSALCIHENHFSSPESVTTLYKG
jgi:hypothetical protein